MQQPAQDEPKMTQQRDTMPSRTQGGSDHIVHSLDDKPREESSMKRIIIGVYIVLFLLGIGTGYVMAQGAGTPAGTPIASEDDGTGVPKVAGVKDADTFKDTAEGLLEAGGLDGEGTHHLTRDGGPSQTVYMVSSVIDLDQYDGKRVKVWGETMAAKKAPWLMDVGRLEVQ